MLHLDDSPWLAQSPLVALPEVQRRSAGMRQLFAEGQALSSYLSEVLESVTDRLVGSGKVGLLRAALLGVREGKSIAQIAREQHLSREHFSKTYWSAAVKLVASAVLADFKQHKTGYTTCKGRETERLPSTKLWSLEGRN